MYPAPGTGYGGGFGGNAPAGVGGGHNREVRYKVVVTADTSHAQQQLANLTASAHQAGNAARLAAPYGVLPAADRPAYQPGYSAAQYAAAYGAMSGRPMPAYASAYGPQAGPSPAAPAAGPAGGGGVAIAAFNSGLAGLTTALTSAAAAVTALGQASNAATLSLRNTVTARAKWNDGLGAVPLVGGALQSIANPIFDARETYGTQPGSYVRRGIDSGLAKAIYDRARADKGAWGRLWQDSWFDFDKIGSVLAAGAAESGMADDRLFNAPFDQQRGDVRRQESYATEDLEYGDALIRRNTGTRRQLGRDLRGLLFAPARDFVGPPGFRTSFDANNEYDAMIRAAARGEAGARAGVGSARNEYELARGQRLASDTQLTRMRGGYEEAIAKRDALAEQAKTDTNVNKDRNEAIAEATKRQADYQAEAVRYQEMLNREKRAGFALAEREYELSQRTLDVDRARLDVLERKRDKVKGYAEQFGTMDPVRQQGVLNVAERADRVGFQGLTPEEKELLLATGATQEFARERSRKAAFDSPAFRQVLRQVGQQDQEVLDAEIAKVKRKVEVEYELNEKKFEEQMNEVLKRMELPFTDAIAKVVGAQLQAIENRRRAAMAGNR